VGGELGEGLGVGEDGEGGVAQKGGVPHAHHAQQHRYVVLKRRRPEVLIHIVRACAARECLDTSQRQHKGQRQ
jgi:hypothetical protein